MTVADILIVNEQVGIVEVRDGEGDIVAILEPTADVIQIVTNDLTGPQGIPGVQGDPGPSGPMGATGPAGPQGPYAPIFEQRFAGPLATWVIVHNLDSFPTVDLYDMDGFEISGDVQMPDRNTVVVTFEVPIAGTARLKA